MDGSNQPAGDFKSGLYLRHSGGRFQILVEYRTRASRWERITPQAALRIAEAMDVEVVTQVRDAITADAARAEEYLAQQRISTAEAGDRLVDRAREAQAARALARELGRG